MTDTATSTDATRDADHDAVLTRAARAIDARIRALDTDARTITGTASTGAIDRYGEVVLPEAFKGLPDDPRGVVVFAASHQYVAQDGTPTILGVIDELSVDDDGLRFRATFNQSALADEWMARVADGSVTGVSIGFCALAGEWRDVRIGESKQRVYHYTSVDLMEISLTPIPANPQATVRRDADQAALRGAIDAAVTAATAPLVERLATLEGEITTLLAKVGDGFNELLVLLAPSDGYDALPDPSSRGSDPDHSEQHDDLNENLRAAVASMAPGGDGKESR